MIEPRNSSTAEAFAVGSAGAASTKPSKRRGIVRAREAQADKLFKECLEIADRGSESENENPPRIQRDRLRIDTRKWMAARLAPKKYGDRISHDVKGGGINFQPQILISCSSAGEEQEYN